MQSCQIRLYVLEKQFSLYSASGAENLFGTYYEKGDLIAKTDVNSTEDPDDPLTNANRYVLADITSFFTLLVGIYFPSVTGERLDAPVLTAALLSDAATPFISLFPHLFIDGFVLFLFSFPPQGSWLAPTALETCVMPRSPSP